MEGSCQAVLARLKEVGPLSPEQFDDINDLTHAKGMQNLTDGYASAQSVEVTALGKEYDALSQTLKALLDQMPEDSPEKRAMLTELADVYAQMRALGKG